MIHAFDDSTGDPTHDNAARNVNRMMTKRAHAAFRVTARNRRRRALIKRAEMKTYVHLVAAAMVHQGFALTPTNRDER